MIDSSVAIKWFVPEPQSDRADELLRSEERLIAPSLILADVANVMWRKVRLSEATVVQVTEAIDELETILILRPLDSNMITSAFEVATRAGHLIYDCVFLACAIAENAHLVTADAKFAEKVASGQFRSFLRRLA